MAETITFWIYVVLVAMFLHLLPLVLRGVWQRLRPAAALPYAAPAAPQQPVAEGVRLLLVGAPGSGKSTVTRQVVRDFMTRGAQVVVLDPDGAAWPTGCQMLGAPDDWPTIGSALDKVAQIAQRRRSEFQRGSREFAALVVVVDEAPAVLKHVPNAVGVINDISARGRKLNISLVLVVQDTGAKTLNLEGLTKILDRFPRFDIRNSGGAVTLMANAQVVRTLAFGGETDLQLPPVVTTPAPAPAPRPASSVTSDAERILREALGTPLPAANAVAEGVTAAGRAVSPVADVTVPALEATEIAQIAHLLATLPPSEVTKRLDGYTPRRYAEFRARVDYVRELLDRTREPREPLVASQTN